MPPRKNFVIDVFSTCCKAARNGELIHRATRQDKEFHFQDWFEAQLKKLQCPYDPPARNTYPDFRMVEIPEGYEIKALAYPGREANYDSNSQVPAGHHNGRTIYYVFGRYPANAEEDEYPLIDLLICHGDFLNADHEYVHKNRNIKGFGSYGDIMIRDRKMYVAPTPFALTDGTTGQQTLVLPAGTEINGRLTKVGNLTRVEAEKLVVGYTFDLKGNTIKAELVDNPGAGKEHEFAAYRLTGDQGPEVTIKTPPPIEAVDEER